VCMQVKWSGKVPETSASTQVHPEPHTEITPLRPPADQHTVYVTPQQLPTGNDVTGSRQWQPEVREVHIITKWYRKYSCYMLPADLMLYFTIFF